MGKPGCRYGQSPASECIAGVEGTRGSETSQYPQEKKITYDSASSGERTWIRLNHMRVIPGRGCVCGVVGPCCAVLPCRALVVCVSGSGLECPAVDGESPVRENACSWC